MSGPPLSEGALPPWDCSVVHFASDPNHTDVLLRCSHMIGDGQLFMQLLKDVLDEIDDDGEPLSAGGPSDSDASVRGGGAAGSAGAGGSGGGAGGSDGGSGRGSPKLIRAVRSQSAFLPPPSMERSKKGRKGPKRGKRGSGGGDGEVGERRRRRGGGVKVVK
jgi:hypothetical protein